MRAIQTPPSAVIRPGTPSGAVSRSISPPGRISRSSGTVRGQEPAEWRVLVDQLRDPVRPADGVLQAEHLGHRTRPHRHTGVGQGPFGQFNARLRDPGDPGRPRRGRPASVRVAIPTSALARSIPRVWASRSRYRRYRDHQAQLDSQEPHSHRGCIHQDGRRPDNYDPPQRHPATKPEARLVVDDETNIVELLSVSLKFQGFEVHTAANGPAALDRAPREVRPTR